MTFGDVLKKRISELSGASVNKKSDDTFWIKLRNIAVEEINMIYPDEIDSSIAVEIYYEILNDNVDFLPEYYREKLKSNNQERFRVLNRNMWTSNAYHPDGLANQKYVHSKKQINSNRVGRKIIYLGDKDYVDSK